MAKASTYCCRCNRKIKTVVTINSRSYGVACAKLVLEGKGFKLPSNFSGNWDQHQASLSLMTEIDFDMKKNIQDITIEDCLTAFQAAGTQRQVEVFENISREWAYSYYVIELSQGLSDVYTFYYEPKRGRLESINGLKCDVSILNINKVFKKIIELGYEL